jgi:hypothetical protein
VACCNFEFVLVIVIIIKKRFTIQLDLVCFGPLAICFKLSPVLSFTDVSRH